MIRYNIDNYISVAIWLILSVSAETRLIYEAIRFYNYDGIRGILFFIILGIIIILFIYRLLDLPYKMEISKHVTLCCTSILTINEVDIDDIRSVITCSSRLPFGYILCNNGKKIWIYKNIYQLKEFRRSLRFYNGLINDDDSYVIPLW